MTDARTPDIHIGNTSYTIQKTLGKGVFGEVYLAKDTATDELVAIKKFSFNKEAFEAPLRDGLESYLQGAKLKLAELAKIPSKENQAAHQALKATVTNIENDKEAFLEKKREAYYNAKRDEYDKIIAEMNEGAAHEHKMLTRVGEAAGPLEAREAAKTTFIAMKLVQGENLTKVMLADNDQSHPLSPEKRDSIAAQVMNKVLFLQEKAIVLRDLHPNNIMYDAKKDVVGLIDYGDALETKEGEAVGQAMGSEPYLAPEVMQKADARHEAIQEVSYNEKTTVFTLGAMLARLYGLADIVKSANFKSEGERPEMFRTIKLREANTDKSKVEDPDVRRELLLLFQKMTEKKPENRTLTLRAAKAQLRVILGGQEAQKRFTDNAEINTALSKYDLFKGKITPLRQSIIEVSTPARQIKDEVHSDPVQKVVSPTSLRIK